MILLVRASNIAHDSEGNVMSFNAGEKLAEFKTVKEFIAWVDAHLPELDENIQPFTGSASLFTDALAWYNKRRKEVIVQ